MEGLLGAGSFERLQDDLRLGCFIFEETGKRKTPNPKTLSPEPEAPKPLFGCSQGLSSSTKREGRRALGSIPTQFRVYILVGQ